MGTTYRQINQTIFEGNAGADPEFHESNGVQRASFTLYNTRRWTKDGEAKEKTVRVSVTAWGNQAEFVRDHVEKGAAYEVVGSLDERTWEDKDTGKNRSALSIRLQEIYFRGRSAKASESTESEEE